MWYLDCGNRPAAGQILSGSSLETDSEFYNFGGLGCARLPYLISDASQMKCGVGVSRTGRYGQGFGSGGHSRTDYNKST